MGRGRRELRGPRDRSDPAATARAWATDAYLSALLTDATDIKAVCHLGRTIPARLRTAVQMRDRTCVVPGCDVGRQLEIDHIEAVTDGGPPASTTSPGRAGGTTT